MPLSYKRVREMEVLGSMLDSEGSTTRMVNHRLEKAEHHFWAHSKAYMGGGTISQKLKAWETGTVACAAFDCAIWSISKTLLHRIRRWESRWLRKLLRLRRKPDEGAMQYNVRTNKLIHSWFERTGTKMLHQRIL